MIFDLVHKIDYCFTFCMIFGFLLNSDFQAQLMFDYNNT